MRYYLVTTATNLKHQSCCNEYAMRNSARKLCNWLGIRTVINMLRLRLWPSCLHYCASVAKQCNLIQV